MKPPVAVTMITMGTVLILAPVGADYLFQRNLVSLLTTVQPISATVMCHLSSWYRIVCWLTGSLMVLIGALAGLAHARASHLVEMGGEVDDEDDGKEV